MLVMEMHILKKMSDKTCEDKVLNEKIIKNRYLDIAPTRAGLKRNDRRDYLQCQYEVSRYTY